MLTNQEKQCPSRPLHVKGGAEFQRSKPEGLVIVADLDGTLFDHPQFVERILKRKTVLKLLKGRLNLEEFSIENNIDKLYDIVLDSPCGKRAVSQLYEKRRPKEFMVELIKELIKQGNLVCFATAFSDKELAEERLKKHGIEGYYNLVVREKGESAVPFKINLIKELGAKIVIDDSEKIIKEVRRALPEVKSIHCQETRIRTPEKIIEEVKEGIFELRNEAKNEPLSEINNEISREIKK